VLGIVRSSEHSEELGVAPDPSNILWRTRSLAFDGHRVRSTRLQGTVKLSAGRVGWRGVSPAPSELLSHRGYRHPAGIISHAVWLYFRFSLSLRDVEEMMAERGATVTYETLRAWRSKFGPSYAAGLCRGRAR
jgi:hypothetical protein